MSDIEDIKNSFGDFIKEDNKLDINKNDLFLNLVDVTQETLDKINILVHDLLDKDRKNTQALFAKLIKSGIFFDFMKYLVEVKKFSANDIYYEETRWIVCDFLGTNVFINHYEEIGKKILFLPNISFDVESPSWKTEFMSVSSPQQRFRLFKFYNDKIHSFGDKAPSFDLKLSEEEAANVLQE